VKRTLFRVRIIAGLAATALALAACGGNDDDAASPSTGGGDKYSGLSGSLKASGASFPDAYYQEVVTAFQEATGDGVTVDYNATGSSTGKKEFGSGLTDFAGTDSLVKDTDGVPAGSFLYVPTVAAPITISYNLSGVDKLQLSADTIAKIFQRTVKTWNDPAIVADNPEGQDLAKEANFAALPTALRDKALAQIEKIQS
jgi:phosphate transport system substrate-binding protein